MSPTEYGIGDRPYVTYVVIDWFPLQVGQHEFRAMLAVGATVDMLAIPNVEPAVCFIPVPGTGYYGASVARPSILFWQEEFWIPLYSIYPKREDIAKHVYGDDVLEKHIFDVLMPVDVTHIPDIDLLTMRTLDSSKAPEWIPR